MDFVTSLMATTQALTNVRPSTHAIIEEKEEVWIVVTRWMWTPKHALCGSQNTYNVSHNSLNTSKVRRRTSSKASKELKAST